MVANKYAFLQITRRRFLNEWEAFKKVISRRNIRRRITIPLTLSNLKLLRRITRTENILHRNFTRRQVAIQNRVASNIGISQSTFSVKVLNLFSRSRRKTNKRKSKHSAMLRNKETRHRMFIGLMTPSQLYVFMPPNLGGFFMVRSYYPSECHADYFDFERIEALKPAIEACGISTLSQSPMLGFHKQMDNRIKLLEEILSFRMQGVEFDNGDMYVDGHKAASDVRDEFVSVTEKLMD